MGPQDAIKLIDCARHGRDSGAELFIVEGDSAAKAVAAVCDLEFQAVLPMQGKPVNAIKARPEVVRRYGLYQAVFSAMGYESTSLIDPNQSRFSRVVLLFDPDADGIHCGALMLMFFYRMMKPVLEDGIVCLARAPMFEISMLRGAQDHGETYYAFTEEHARNLVSRLQAEPGVSCTKKRYRGLASLGAQTLLTTCLAPPTRTLNRLRVEDAEAAIAAFGGGPF